MTREGKAELDKILGFAQEAGYEVTAHGPNTWWVRAPGGDRVLVPGSPRGRELLNQKKKLERIGVPVTKEQLRARLKDKAEKEARRVTVGTDQGPDQTDQIAVAAEPTGVLAATDASASPAAPTTDEALDMTFDIRLDAEPAQVSEPAARFDAEPPAPATNPFNPQAGEPAAPPTPAAVQTPPAPSKPAALTPDSLETLTEAAAYSSGDVSLLAYTLWRKIRRMPDLSPTTLITERGLIWRGQFKKVLRETWPELSEDTRRQLHKYITDSGNMHCVKRHENPPLWWLRDEWVQTDTPTAFFTARTPSRRTAPRVTAGPPAPVTTRRIEPAPADAAALEPAAERPTSPDHGEIITVEVIDDGHSDTRAAEHYVEDATTEDAPTGSSLAAEVARIVARNEFLESRLMLLEAQNVALTRQVAKLKGLLTS